MNKELCRKMCESIVQALVGDKLKDGWWKSSNRAFDNRTPEEVWTDEKEWIKVYRYLMGQMNGDFS